MAREAAERRQPDHVAVCLPVSLVLVVAGPVFLAAVALAGLARSGIAGALAAVGLVGASLWCCRRAGRALRQWWARAGLPHS